MTPLTVIPEEIWNLWSAEYWSTRHNGRAFTERERAALLAALNADRSAESERVKTLVTLLEDIRDNYTHEPPQGGRTFDGCEPTCRACKAEAALSAYEKGEKG